MAEQLSIVCHRGLLRHGHHPRVVERKPSQTEDVDRRDGRHTGAGRSGGSCAPGGPAFGPTRTVHGGALGSPGKRCTRPAPAP